MAGLFNRLKNRKTGPNLVNNNTENEPTTPVCSFDEQGFLCPMCHQKFSDHTQLAQHYTESHSEESIQDKTLPQSDEIQEKLNSDIELWKQQVIASEESRVLLTNELIQEKQRVNDFEEGIQLLQKQLKTTQSKVLEQSQEIANLKATKDVYDAQLTIFSNELLHSQNQLKQKEEQETSKLTNDNINTLKTEIIQKDEQIEKLRSVLIENYQYTKRLDKFETRFKQNLLIYDEIISKNILPIENEINQIKQFIKLTHQRKEKLENIIKSMHNNLTRNQIQIKQLTNDLEQQKELNKTLNNDLQKQTNSSRNQIDLLNHDIQQLETTLNDLKEEKNQFIQTKMDGDQDDQRQNLVRQLTSEKNQYEQQIKDLRIQIKQKINEQQETQDEIDKISKQLTNEKIQLQNEQTQLKQQIDLLKNQLDNNNKDKERQTNELNQIREQYSTIENNYRDANENNTKQKQEIERIKIDLTKQINRLEDEKTELINQKQELTNKTLVQLTTMEKEKDNLVQQLQTTLSQLHAKLDKRNNYIQRLSIGIRHSTVLAYRTHEYIEENIQKSQMNLLATLEKAGEESRLNRTRTTQQIREEFTTYLTTVHEIILDSKNKLDKQIEKDNLNILEQQEQLNKIKNEYEKLDEEYHEQKQKFQIQLGEMNQNLLQVSESLSQSTQTANRQRENYEKQIISLEREIESRTKKHDMQLAALTENLATVRSELKMTHEKLATIDQIKAEKTDIEARLVVSQDERRVLLERSLANENKNDKLIAENGQIAKKNTELESALLEIAREYQVLQIQTNALSQRRWLDDEDVDACMKCNQTFKLTQRKHHCRNCGNIFCDNCSSKTAIIGASSRKQKRVCDQCYKDLTS